jgi:hypothetical protein
VPNHITAGFPQDCTICHSTLNWTPSTFNHSTTAFPLTGAHIAVACVQCHTNNNYSGTLPTTCDGCHDSLYQKTATMGGSVPNHVAQGYPKTCDSCHTTTSWLGATFDHNTTGFPLTGAHITTTCNLCHTSSVRPPTDCYSCHTAQWQSTVNLGGSVPNHVAASQIPGTQFLTSACGTCHTTTNWLGATFTHNWWDVNHHGAGGICGTCHTNSSDYSVFVCSNGVCHARPGVDNRHQGNPQYVWSSGVTCYNCHKGG